MKELTYQELQEIDGGFWQIIVVVALALIAAPTIGGPESGYDMNPGFDPNLGETDLASGASASVA